MTIQPPDPQKINVPTPPESPTGAAETLVTPVPAEAAPVPPKPEVTQSPTPEVPSQAEVDHISTVAPVPISDDATTVTDQPVDDPAIVTQDPLEAVKTPVQNAIDDIYRKSVDEAIDMFEEKPYEEEEKAEDLQIRYLHDRFGKEIKKTEDE